MMKNKIEMDQTNEMNEINELNEFNCVSEQNRANDHIEMNGMYSEHSREDVLEMNRMYGENKSKVTKEMNMMNNKNNMNSTNNKMNSKNMNSMDTMFEVNLANTVFEMNNMDEMIKVEGMNERLELGTSADNMAPITVSRKVTHRRGRKAGRGAGRVSMLVGACAMTLGLTMVAPSAGAQKLEQGIRSEHVLQLQEQLSDLGYFDAGLTGYYGSITKGAVREFQQAQGLSADGVAGPATLNRLNKKADAEGKTLRQLAKLIHGEARGESFEGQVAVGAVVLNRVQSGEFPSSISEVIFQKGQFTAIDDGQFNQKPTQTSYRAARQALNGADPTNGALYYYNPKIATSIWSKSRPTLLTIGEHDFTR